jgi:hypothetical protein
MDPEVHTAICRPLVRHPRSDYHTASCRMTLTEEEKVYLSDLILLACGEHDPATETNEELATTVKNTVELRLGALLRVGPEMPDFVERKALKRRLEGRVQLRVMECYVRATPEASSETVGALLEGLDLEEEDTYSTRYWSFFRWGCNVSYGSKNLTLCMLVGVIPRVKPEWTPADLGSPFNRPSPEAGRDDNPVVEPVGRLSDAVAAAATAAAEAEELERQLPGIQEVDIETDEEEFETDEERLERERDAANSELRCAKRGSDAGDEPPAVKFVIREGAQTPIPAR